MWCKATFSAAIDPVSVTWSFQNNSNMVIWCSGNLIHSYYYQCWNQFFAAQYFCWYIVHYYSTSGVKKFFCWHGLASVYLTELWTVYTPRSNLRSSDSGLLTIPITRLRSMGDQAFSSVAPKLWNSLPTEIRQAESFSDFKSSLKTFFFFRLAYLWFFIVFSIYFFCMSW